MVKKTTIYYWILGIFVVLDGFLIYGYPQRYFEFIFSAFIFILFLVDNSFRRAVSRDKSTFILLMVLLALSAFQELAGRYGGVYSLSNTCLFIGSFCFFYYSNIKEEINENVDKKFSFSSFIFVVMLMSLMYQFITRITEDQAVVNNIYEVYYTLGRDKNVLGIIVFCFFGICFRRKSKLGVFICLAFALTLNSRMLVLNLLIFCIAHVFHRPLYKMFEKILKEKIWILFLLSFIVIIVFSTAFVAYCTTNGIGKYQESWNDGSNYMRMTSNLFALNKIRSDPYFIWGGSDNYIYLFLGISDSVRYLGERVVQPHNDIINLLVRCGLIYSLIYWKLYGKLLSKNINEDNIDLFVPFFFASMFIQPIFLGVQGIMVMYVLSLKDRRNSKSHKLKWINVRMGKS